MPSSPIRFSAGTRMSSKNTSVVAWFIMVRIGRIVSPAFLASRMSTMNTDNPSVRFFDLLLRRGAREQDHQVGMFGAAGPDLLAVDDIAVMPSRLANVLQRGGVGAAGRLGDAERLQAQFAAGDLRQPLRLLLLAAVPQQRAHGVHLGVAAAAVAARRAGSPPGSPRPPKASGRRRHIPPGSAPRDSRPRVSASTKSRRIGHLAVELAPVFAGELGAEFGDRVADVGMFVLAGLVRSLDYRGACCVDSGSALPL